MASLAEGGIDLEPIKQIKSKKSKIRRKQMKIKKWAKKLTNNTNN